MRSGSGFEVLRRYAAVKEQLTAAREEEVTQRYRQIVGGLRDYKIDSTPSSSGRQYTECTSNNKCLRRSQDGKNNILDDSNISTIDVTDVRNSMNDFDYTHTNCNDKGVMFSTPGNIHNNDNESQSFRSSDGFLKLAKQVHNCVELVQTLQLHIFPKFKQQQLSHNKNNYYDTNDNEDLLYSLKYNGNSEANIFRSEQQAHCEVDRMYKSLMMLRMIIDAKLETTSTYREQLEKELNETTTLYREEQKASCAAREALLKLEAVHYQDREAIRHDVETLKRMYEEELGKFRSRLDEAECLANISESKLIATEQHVQRLQEMFEEEQAARTRVEKSLMEEQVRQRDATVAMRMLEQENAALKAEVTNLNNLYQQQQQQQQQQQ